VLDAHSGALKSLGIGLMGLHSSARILFVDIILGIVIAGAHFASAEHEPVKAPPVLNTKSSEHSKALNATAADHSGTPFPVNLLHARGQFSSSTHEDINVKPIHTSEVQISSKTQRLNALEKDRHKHGHKHKVGHKSGHTVKAPGIIVYGQVAPTYIPKIGIANVTKATATPPPPPTLNPYEDYQPMDTAIGDYIMKQFQEPPTATPPPLQAAISAAFACPLFLLPGRIWVETPTGCDSDRHGVWYDASRKVLLMWNESCVAFPNAVNADMKYTLPYGDVMGTSVTHLSWSKDVVEIFDCGAGSMYTFTEKVYKRLNAVDPFVCEAYGICDYELFLQYFITSSTGVLMAHTAYLSYFQREIVLLDPAMIPIATLQRKGNWSPKDKCPGYEKEWTVTFGGSASPLAAPPNRWIVASFTTVMALRDEDRDLNGFIQPSKCQKWSFSFLALSIFLAVGAVIVLSLVFWLCIKERMQVCCFQLESIIFPKTQYKASKFDP